METKKDILEHIKSKPKSKPDDAYFEQFRAKMMDEIRQQPKGKVLYLRPLFWLSATAAAVILVFGVRFFLNDEQTTNFASVSKKEIEQYLRDNESGSVWEVGEEPEEEAAIPGKQPESHPADEPDKHIEIASTEGFVSSRELLEQISTEELYEYIENEEFDLEELEYTQF